MSGRGYWAKQVVAMMTCRTEGHVPVSFDMFCARCGKFLHPSDVEAARARAAGVASVEPGGADRHTDQTGDPA